MIAQFLAVAQSDNYQNCHILKLSLLCNVANSTFVRIDY